MDIHKEKTLNVSQQPPPTPVGEKINRWGDKKGPRILNPSS